MFHVLCVDDEEDILEVSKEFLEASGQMIVDTAVSVKEAKKAIIGKDYDAIVSDYQMPETDGLSFLKDLRSRGYQIPFILFTGRGREEVVIEALNSGANFYVQKGGNPKAQFAELIHKIIASIERGAAEDSLKESEELFRSLSNNVFDGMAVTKDGKVLDVNRSFTELLGYGRDELIGTNAIDYFTESSKETAQREMMNSSGRPYVANVVRKDGKVLTIEIRGNTVRWKGGTARLAAIQNITDRVGFEERLKSSEEMLNLALEGSDLGRWDFSVPTGDIEINERWAGMLGYNIDEIAPVTRETTMKLVHPDDVDESIRVMNRYLSGEIDHYECEMRMRHKDGHWVWVLSKGRISKRDRDGKPLHMSGTHLDVSRMKKVEEALKESEKKYRSLVESANEGILVIQDGVVRLANPKASKIIAKQADGIVAKPYLTAVYKDDVDVVKEIHRKRLAGEPTPDRYDIRIVGIDGKMRWVSISGILIDWEGRPATLNLLTDVTDRKMAEDALKESEKKYRSLIEGISEAIVVVQDGVFRMANPKACKIIGHREEDIISRSVLTFIHPDDKELVAERNKKRMAGEELPERYDFRIVNNKGEIHWVALSAISINWEGRPATLNLLVDVTDRKKMEDELKHQSATLQILNNIIVTANSANDLTELFENVLSMTIDLMNFKCGGIYLLDEKTRTAKIVHSRGLSERVLESIGTVSIDEEPYSTIFLKKEPIVTQDHPTAPSINAERKGFRSWACIPLLSKDKVIGSLNVASDEDIGYREDEKPILRSIGKELGSTIVRMMAELDARKAADNLSTLLDSIEDMIIVTDFEGRILKTNDACKKQLSYNDDEIEGKNVRDLHPSEELGEARNFLKETIAGTSDHCMLHLMSKDGRQIPTDIRVATGWWYDQKAIFGSCRDITERLKTDEAMKQSEAKFREIFNSANDGIHLYEIDSDLVPGRFIDINEVGCQMLGYTREEMLNMTYADFATTVYRPSMKEMKKRLSEDGRVKYETFHRRRDGSAFPVEINAHQVNMMGKEMVIAVVRDVTERKKIESMMKESEERIRLILNSAAEAVFGLDIDGRCTFCNDSCVRVLGYADPEDLLGKNMHGLVHNKNADGAPHKIEECNIFQSILKGVRAHADDEVLWRADGTPLHVEYWSNPQMIDEIVVGAVVTFLDITERKRLEMEVKQKADELELFSESLASANKKLSLLNSITRHDIINQMTALSGYIEICERKEKDDAIKKYFRKMMDSLENMKRQISSMKEYQDIGVKAPVWGSISKQMQDAFSILNPKDIVLEDEARSIEYLADPLAEKVSYNLIDNSMRHGKHVSRIKLSARQDGDAVTFIYEDDGEGIEEENKERIFEKGFGKNTGFGLFLSREIMAITGISITETGAPGKGARFEIIVPKGAWRENPA